LISTRRRDFSDHIVTLVYHGAMAEPNKYRHLPEPVKLEDTVEIMDESPVPDPQAGRDTERDFMLRYAG
jgi:hypothetical protein